MSAGGGSTEGRPESLAERVRRWWRFLYRSAFGARSPIVEEMGFKIPLFPVQWGLLATGVLLVALSLLLTETTSYDRDNYRYMLSAELQSVAAIFALVITGSALAAQIARVPSSGVVFVVTGGALMTTLLVNVVVMGVDVAALARLPESPSPIGVFSVNLAVVMNGAAVLFTLGYIGTAVLLTQPRIYVAAVLHRMDEADDLARQKAAIAALEELGLHAGERRDVRTCHDVIRGVVTAARVLVEKPGLSVDEALGWPEQPFQLLPQTLGNLGQAWARDALDRPVSAIAAALGSIALGYSQYDDRLVDADFPVAMTDIMRSCIRQSREIALYDFLANKRSALERLKEGSAERAVTFWAASIREEIRLCADARLVDAGGCVVKQLEVLVEAAAAHQLDAAGVRDLLEYAQSSFAATGMLRSVPAFERWTLGDGIQRARLRLKQLEGETH